ncbi:bifunctional 3-hexulose-6-phosphate synthase/6-phospho-3-hexuloisomerase [Methylotuvimicrobium sp. KM2]|uniref:bifunctional 3-hexulose-6-phosphate synthase/6-phospho-3-hexuloisomerase n=1 Tax=Methylotuvimicrobium sp. KM2 TaxID=3133976 RepID=UPI0031017D7B
MAKPLIQLALDSLDFDKTLELASQAAPYVDIIEIGTPCIKFNGLELVKEIKRRFPDKLLLVDLKTMDAGEYEASPFYEAGADICTVLGTSGISTIKGVISAAKKYNAEVQVDLINVEDKASCAAEAVAAGAQIIGIHTGIDAQAAGQTPFADLQDLLRLGLNTRVSVAGGIKPETVRDVVKAGVDIIVVGGAITGAPSPANAARKIQRLVNSKGTHREFVVDKISDVLYVTDDSYDRKLTSMLDQARRIFVSGAGRSGLIGRFFAMRLMHSGYDTSVVGEIVTPSIKQGDLLIIISGSGETEQLVAFTKRARDIGAQIVLISAKSESTIGDMADAVFRVGSPEQYGKVIGMPMGTVFELSTLAFLEATISHVIHEKGIPEEEMRSRHANLE